MGLIVIRSLYRVVAAWMNTVVSYSLPDSMCIARNVCNCVIKHDMAICWPDHPITWANYCHGGREQPAGQVSVFRSRNLLRISDEPGGGSGVQGGGR